MFGLFPFNLFFGETNSVNANKKVDESTINYKNINSSHYLRYQKSHIRKIKLDFILLDKQLQRLA
ncbi:hypothetical protein VCRA2122O12_30018 [Vibrio crassostreae]|nr:hypothetical protein VCRA2110O182_100019 [Vibrio crassostreae]CAK1817231.1 hypothetical protein VCRA2119O431_10018 [Vibrio crassostreae]CAK1819489.1 hypothetical protein VCRA2114O422_10018 [Vibrio crassostreae]CAK1821743.1 hypothetical protein VCRA2113O409_10018 [Vibrio crassostreae]CAK1826435.1 hypothetical protein VCRA2119O430_10018 [Vibrio crassostreae]